MPEGKEAGEPWRAPEQAGDGGSCNVVTRPLINEEMVVREKEEAELGTRVADAAEKLEKKAVINERGRS